VVRPIARHFERHRGPQSVEELAGRVKRGWWIVVNDHHRGYKAMPLAPEDRPLVCIWHPTKPGVVLMMTTLDFGQRNAPYFFSTFSASLLQQITAWLGEDGFSMYYLDDNGTVCRAERAQPLVDELDAIAAQAGFTYALAKRQVGLTFDVDTNELKITGGALIRTFVLLSSTVGLIDAAASDMTAHVDVVDEHFVERLTGTLGWLAACSYAGLLHMGPFYYAASLTQRVRTPKLSLIAGLREACVWWLDRAALGREQSLGPS
jgi:hypothetical protein